MNNNGWRALIYDATWARFKTGQTGVFVSEDGRMCETIDDNRDNVLIEADPNLGFTERTSGHILFKQKGTDLFDIVCLEQAAGGVFELFLTGISATICSVEDSDTIYDTLNNTLASQGLVQYSINGGERHALSAGDFTVIMPNRSGLKSLAQIVSETNQAQSCGLMVTIRFSDGNIYSSNTATFTAVPGDVAVKKDEKSVFDFSLLKVVVTEEVNGGEGGGAKAVVCQITPVNGSVIGCSDTTVRFTATTKEDSCNCTITKDKTELECIGGTVHFTVDCEEDTPGTTENVYSIDLSKISVYTSYKLESCFTSEDKRVGGSVASATLIRKDGIEVLEETATSLRMHIALNVNSFQIKVVSDLNYSCIATFNKINGEFKVTKNTCTSSTP